MSAPPRYCPNCKCSGCAGYRATSRRKYRGLVGSPRCAWCLKPHDGKRVLCDVCAARFNSKQASRYHSRRAAKQCVECGRDTGGPARCPRCVELRKLVKSRSEAYRRKHGDWHSHGAKKPP